MAKCRARIFVCSWHNNVLVCCQVSTQVYNFFCKNKAFGIFSWNQGHCVQTTIHWVRHKINTCVAITEIFWQSVRNHDSFILWSCWPWETQTLPQTQTPRSSCCEVWAAPPWWSSGQLYPGQTPGGSAPVWSRSSRGAEAQEETPL